MSSRSKREKNILIAIGVVAAVTLVYSIVIAQAILQWFSIVIPLLFLYLVWRFIRAHERIAAALEARQNQPTDRETTDK